MPVGSNMKTQGRPPNFNRDNSLRPDERRPHMLHTQAIATRFRAQGSRPPRAKAKSSYARSRSKPDCHPGRHA
eukprot:7858436-Pyramimonas_sp.AAC.1